MSISSWFSCSHVEEFVKNIWFYFQNFACQSYAFLLLVKLHDNQNMQHTIEISVMSYQIMFLVFLHFFFYKNGISNWKLSKFSHKLFALWNELKFCLQHLLIMNLYVRNSIYFRSWTLSFKHCVFHKLSSATVENINKGTVNERHI